MQKAIVIGAGIAGLAASVRLALRGYKVLVFETNAYAGGKLSEFSIQGFRFDAGPSLFTMPQYVDELFALAGKNPRDYFEYQSLDTICHYFYPSGNKVNAYADFDKRVAEYAQKFGEAPVKLEKYFNYSEHIYQLTHRVFLERSLHRLKNYFRKDTLSSALQFGKIDAFRTQHDANACFFSNPELVQLFDRYATYNGSNPYEAPATLNVIPHFENGFGAYLPKGGMNIITQSLERLAKELGVELQYQTPVLQIKTERRKVKGVQTPKGFYEADVVFSNADVWFTYQKLLSETVSMPRKIKNQERSSSALIFYWGIKKSFQDLGLHNIFFSDNYQEEFSAIFSQKTVSSDPTVYVNITSKLVATDAPKGQENWFVMVNVPHDTGQDWQQLTDRVRENILAKLSKMLNQNIRELIVCEKILDPVSIQYKTGSYQGSLYGSSSNGKFSAFLRHPNFISEISGLYFCGGSVHPGGGIPLALLSAKIATDMLAL